MVSFSVARQNSEVDSIRVSWRNDAERLLVLSLPNIFEGNDTESSVSATAFNINYKICVKRILQNHHCFEVILIPIPWSVKSREFLSYRHKMQLGLR